jgi:aminopeptidase N
MKRSLYIILFLGLQCLSTLAQKPDLIFSDKMALQESKSFHLKSSFVESQNYSAYDLIYQRMEWEINPHVRYIKGNVTSYVKSLTQELNEIEFDLDSVMLVDSIKQNNQILSFSRIANKVIIPLLNPLSENQLDSLKIYYQGEPKESGFGTFSKTMHNNVPNIWTLSEPYGAMEWWPCKQSLSDKIDSIDIIVTTPVPFRTASNGVLVSEEIKDEFNRMHWKHRFPIASYLLAISITNYDSYSDFLNLIDGRQIEVLNYVYPEDLNEAKTKTPQTLEIMSLFNDLIGEYPFADEKYGHAQFGWGGGMEHQTMSFMANFEFGLIAHELAHQWFGDYITLGTWQDIWLNEGFASYLTGLSYEHLQEGIWWPRWRRLSVEKITSEPGGSVFVTDTTNISRLFNSRLSYTKGAYLLHMLRWITGDDQFYSGLQNYFNDPKIANGFATTDQFIEHMENVADTSLTEFFDDWFYGEGFPIYSAQFSSTENNDLKITLSQTTSHNSVEFFEMPVPIRAYSSEKTDSMDFRLEHSFNNQEFIVESGFTVSEIKIDPEYWIVSKTNEIFKL